MSRTRLGSSSVYFSPQIEVRYLCLVIERVFFNAKNVPCYLSFHPSSEQRLQSQSVGSESCEKSNFIFHNISSLGPQKCKFPLLRLLIQASVDVIVSSDDIEQLFGWFLRFSGEFLWLFEQILHFPGSLGFILTCTFLTALVMLLLIQTCLHNVFLSALHTNCVF